MDLISHHEIERSSRQFNRRRTRITNKNQSRTRNRITAIAKMSVFKTNPYKKLLDLDKESDLKLYKEAGKGVDKEDKVDGKKEYYNTFQKLTGKSFREVKYMEALQIPVEWDSNNVDNAAN